MQVDYYVDKYDKLWQYVTADAQFVVNAGIGIVIALIKNSVSMAKV